VTTNIVVPQLGESVVEARVARWLKKAGDAVAAGDPIIELETEKIDLEVGAEHAGVLVEITRKEGEDVQVGDRLGVIDSSASAVAGAVSSAPAAAPPPASSPATDEASARDRATPTARRMASEHAVDLARVPGSGEGGRVIKRDVEQYLSRGVPTAASQLQAPLAAPVSTGAPAPGERREERVRMSKRRATIARNLVQAQHAAAMLTTFNEVDMSGVMALRERRKEAFKQRHGVSLGIVSFFVRASVAALKGFPRLNAEIQGDDMVLKHYYDIGIAVGAAQGLVVPVIKNAETRSFGEIEQAIREFAKRANDGTLTLDDLRGGTFTITNGGVFGSLLSTPILNPPQVGILGLHKIEERPVAVRGEVVVRPMMYTALTYDHRIVDGLEAVQFLVKVKEFIEDPATLLLEG
jgi:2-oxoglutarate dehydrogenase E2 component (dihydrolipoamide succinyltransferase)